VPIKRARKSASQARLERENTHDEIYERIYNAILEHRLPPGTKLEERLAEIFGTSRARIREVLARLAHEQIVEPHPQRGAYVAKPSVEQARDVFEARRLIEPAVMRRLIEPSRRRSWPAFVSIRSWSSMPGDETTNEQ
jgi:DNA-binding GntR family transcriptional regulator